MKILSLFDGISCGRVALERAGIEVEKYYASEIKEDAILVSKSNYPDIIQLGDVTKVNKDMVGEIDLLIGGSPCQSFSNAGKKEGFEGKSGLFYEYVRILKEVKPKFFLLENVKMKKEWLDIITNTLKEIYPETQVYNINSSLVSAQLRNRFYWTNIPNIKQPEDKQILLKDILENGFTNREKARAILESESRPLVNKSNMLWRYIKTGFTTIIFDSEKTYLRVKEATKMKSKNEYYLFDGEDIRYFTQLELERLQTLPEGYTKILNRNKSAGVIGDGWTVDVITHIFKNLK
jgi:DNA (cytosine-5)-methyltransferase 3A